MTLTGGTLAASVAGFGFGMSLIAAIGAQNAYVLRQGLRREHVLPIVAICAATDALLILLGVAGIGVLIEQVPWLLVVIRWFGVAFLIAYGIFALRRAFRPESLDADAEQRPTALRTAILTVLALTWLNPHVYLDTVLLLGSVANTHGDPGRWWFGGGAVIASIVWFSALGFGARALRPLFRNPRAWQVLDVIVALVMFVLALTLILGA